MRQLVTLLVLLSLVHATLPPADASSHAPQITITSPNEDDPLDLGDEVDVRGTAQPGPAPVDEINVSVDGEQLNVQGTEDWQATWTPTEPGSYEIEATTTDEQGNEDSDQVTVTIQDQDPVPTVGGTTLLLSAIMAAVLARPSWEDGGKRRGLKSRRLSRGDSIQPPLQRWPPPGHRLGDN